MFTVGFVIVAMTNLQLLSNQSVLATKAGTNAQAFDVLCTVYNGLEAPVVAADVKAAAQRFANSIGALNMSASSASFKALFSEDPTPAKTAHTKRPAEAGEQQKTWDKYYDFWVSSAKMKNMQQNGHVPTADKLPDNTKQRLKYYAEKAFQATTSTVITDPAKKKAEFETAHDKAIYRADKTANPEFPAITADRKAECEVTQGLKGSKAGTSIRTDFLCPCAKSTNSDSQDKTCCQDCTMQASATTWSAAKEGNTIYTVLAGNAQKSQTQSGNGDSYRNRRNRLQ
uniref:Variant surface glycoprotein 1815 n=1 Tax=Trypanosoma brucei TaxID=5691 RepID=M4SXE8_9TRYP|nr:variant surface glycoprotein 1815 [Trypanosoma brucei]